MFGKVAAAFAAFGLVLGITSSAHAKKSYDECYDTKKGEYKIKPEHELKMVTLAPAGSEWSKQFNAWSKEVAEESDCKLALKWYFNASNEQSILDDLKSGAKHGAAMTATGLGNIEKNFLLLTLPGIFANWGQLDAARDKAMPDLEELFKKRGFVLAGIGDIGAVKVLSVGAPVKLPKDLSGKGVFHLPGDIVAPKLLSLVPGATAKPMALTELSTHLGKDVQVLLASPFAAEQLQWAPKVENITVYTPGFASGALVFKKEKLDSVGPELSKILLATGKKYGAELTKNIRNFDADALKRMKASKNAITLSPEETAEWEKLFKQTRAAVKGEFDPKLWSIVVGDK